MIYHADLDFQIFIYFRKSFFCLVRFKILLKQYYNGGLQVREVARVPIVILLVLDLI